jgi:hypothetical protein
MSPSERLPQLERFTELNYAGVFLSFTCNLNCLYCINDPGQAGQRGDMTRSGRAEMPPELWVRALDRLPPADDLPITLQGGEPTLYWRGRGIGEILAGSEHRFDLLTNLALPTDRLALCFGGHQERLRRDAPYPSIRASHHVEQMDRAWGNGIAELLRRCEALESIGFTVTPDKATSDVGVYMVAHPGNLAALEAARTAACGRIPFETKEFLGRYDGQTYGTYLYPHSTDLVEGGYWPTSLTCECRTTELLIDPLGFVWPCHYFLYASWMAAAPTAAFERLAGRNFEMAGGDFAAFQYRPLGHILDPGFSLDQLRRWRSCTQYGRCIGCDTKVKNDRFQSLYNQGVAHTSVEIRAIDAPAALRAALALR